MPAVMPGTMRNGTPARASASASSRAAPEDERIAALQPQHALAFARQRNQRARNIALLAGAFAGALAGIDELRARPRQLQQRLVDQRVVENDVGAGDGVQSQRRDQARIARSRACQPHPALVEGGQGQRACQPLDGGPFGGIDQVVRHLTPYMYNILYHMS